MPGPVKPRFVCKDPLAKVFKPRGIPRPQFVMGKMIRIHGGAYTMQNSFWQRR